MISDRDAWRTARACITFSGRMMMVAMALGLIVPVIFAYAAGGRDPIDTPPGSPAVAQHETPAAPRADRIVKTQSGVGTELWAAAAWDGECDAQSLFIRVVQPPTHGTVSVVPTMVRFAGGSSLNGSSVGCIAKPILGKKLMYRSDPRFRGTETIQFRVDTKISHASHTIVVEVQ